MRLQKILFILLALFCVSPLAAFSFKEAIFSTENGSYLLLQHGQWVTFLRVVENEGYQIQLEEITAPAENFLKMRWNARDWYNGGAPGQCSWSVSRLGADGQIDSHTYCHASKTCNPARAINTWLPVLFNLQFEPLPPQRRKKVGPAVGYGRRDERPLWNPRLIVEGKSYENVPFDAFVARWPEDRSELAGRRIEIYLPQPLEGISFPTFFPYFLEIEGKMGSGKLRVIDSGKGLLTPL